MSQDHAIFISYRRRDAAGHARALHRDLCRRFVTDAIFFDRQSIESGDTFPETLRDAVTECRVLLALIGPEWLNDDGLSWLNDPNDYVRQEIVQALELSKKIIPVLFDDTQMPAEDALPKPLKALASCDAHILQGKNYVYDTQLEELVRLVAKVPGVPQPLPDPGSAEIFNHDLPPIPSVDCGKNKSSLGANAKGVAPRDIVFNEYHQLPEIRTFAAELLTQPIKFEKAGGRTLIRIDRTQIENAVYTNKGKEWLCNEFLKDEARKWAIEKDEMIHRFLIGENNSVSIPPLPLHNFPLRWASGGVLSVVTINGRKGKWTPFFFRDIAPIGWNIALGSSEGEDELTIPWRFLLREFLIKMKAVLPPRSSWHTL